MVLKGDDIYLLGIGGTAMGSFAGLLKSMGFKVRGSDARIYSPMKEALLAQNIDYKTPFSKENLKKMPDLAIIGNVIRKENEEAVFVLANDIPYDSFPHALKELVLKKTKPIVITGTHGKTTCTSLMAHTLTKVRHNTGFLIGGIPLNFSCSFKKPDNSGAAFVIEGDEYDTAFFDKGPKFMHYMPHILLATSLEFDHADIFKDLHSVKKVFTDLFNTLKQDTYLVANAKEKDLMDALYQAKDFAGNLVTYNDENSFHAKNIGFNDKFMSFDIYYKSSFECSIKTTMSGIYNVENSLGVFASLKTFGICTQDISNGFTSFLGVKRRMEVLKSSRALTIIDDFAHHPTAVLKTLDGLKQKYNSQKITVIFEPRSATSCLKIFQDEFKKSLLHAHYSIIAPKGRQLDESESLNTKELADSVKGISFNDYDEMLSYLDKTIFEGIVLLMSNGDFAGNKNLIVDKIFKN